MSTLTRLLAVLFTLFAAQFANAEQMQKIGDWDVHYLAYPSTFITPDIAKYYEIQRSNYLGLVNISVLDSQSQAAQSVEVTATARNLLGNIRELSIRKITDQDAIYYIAEVPHRNEETYRFTVTISDGKKQETLKFEQKFYVD